MAPACIVVMGVSGCGKSSVGRQLAAALGVEFLDGDALHPPCNVQRMAAGIALTDADRLDWLRALADRLGAARAAGRGLVVACSALKRSYRDLLRSRCADLRLVHLHGAPALLAQRLAARVGHYMPASLLPSQLDALEAPGADEHALCFDVAAPAAQITAALLTQLRTPCACATGLHADRTGVEP